jgi:uncharacterized protein YprB with RNaseH-like and TPR domain
LEELMAGDLFNPLLNQPQPEESLVTDGGSIPDVTTSMESIEPPSLTEADTEARVTDTSTVLLLGEPASERPMRIVGEAIEYFAPDAIVFVGSDAAHLETQVLHATDSDVTTAKLSRAAGGETVRWVDRRLQLAVAPHASALETLGPEFAANDTVHVLTDQLRVSANETALRASLEGREEWEGAVERSGLGADSDPRAYISTAIPGPYSHDWGDLRVCGAGHESDGPPVARCLTLRGDGSVDLKTREWKRFGLTAITGVGASTAQSLRESWRAVTEREELAHADIAQLSDIDGIGRSRAKTIATRARAFENGAILLEGGGAEKLPNVAPVYIDIETDGLSPSMIWLIGAYDSERGEYRDFVETDSKNPAGALVEFVTWLDDLSGSQPVVAYNGWGFDFTAIEKELGRLAPSLLDVWSSTYRWDPYRWQKDHAVFPGRTNKLEDVAEALGYDGAATGLSGATVGEKFSRWMNDQTPETELAWDLHRRYCEDDVKALAYVCERLFEAAAKQNVSTTTPDETNTSQSTLGGY